MAASSERFSSTSSTPTATGRASWAATISSTASSARTSRSKAWPTTRSASATATGSATAVFEVSQPRVTCYRVGIRMDDPRMPALLVSHNRPGFYLRVLVEGEVQAGDEIFKVASGPERMTVAEVDALLYLPGHPREGVQRALRIPALSPGGNPRSARSSRRKATATRGSLRRARLPPGLDSVRSRVSRVDSESDSIVSIHLVDPDGIPVPAALPGQFLTLRLQPEPGQAVAPAQLFAVRAARRRRLPDQRQARAGRGRAAATCTRTLRVGDRLEIAAPRGTFTLNRAETPVLLISAGVGATPTLAMLHALAAEHSEREVWWLHGARNGADHPFADESRTLLASLANGRGHIAFSRPGRTTSKAETSTAPAASPQPSSPRSSCRATPMPTSAAPHRS